MPVSRDALIAFEARIRPDFKRAVASGLIALEQFFTPLIAYFKLQPDLEHVRHFRSNLVTFGMNELKPFPTDVSDEEWSFAAPYLTLMNQGAPQRRYELRAVASPLDGRTQLRLA